MRRITLQKSANGQAMAPPKVALTRDVFFNSDRTCVYWLGGAGILINSRGTILLIDPVLRDFDYPPFDEPPLDADHIPALSAVLVTHNDSDHMSLGTLRKISVPFQGIHAPHYAAEELRAHGLPGIGHSVWEKFSIGSIIIQLTPVWHNWKNEVKEYSFRTWKREDDCGFYLRTPDGSVWLPGDSRLLEEHLTMPAPDVILFDFSEDSWHISLEGAVKLANAYPTAKLLCIHWGTYDAADRSPFNGNPEQLFSRVQNPQRIRVCAPGEPLVLCEEG